MSWGDWDGLNGLEIEARFPGQMATRQQDKWNYCPPNGENYIMAAERAQAALDDIVALAADKPVAVFAHGAIGRVLRGLFLRVPRDDIMAMDQPQDAFYRLHRGAAERIG
jgi:broad specificity phosphatase PhoE